MKSITVPITVFKAGIGAFALVCVQMTSAVHAENITIPGTGNCEYVLL